MTSLWTFVAVAASAVAALPWDGASPTDPVVAVESLGWTPIPTQPPFSPYGGEMVPMPGKHIFARAFTDQLCGYVNGNSGEFECRRALLGPCVLTAMAPQSGRGPATTPSPLAPPAAACSAAAIPTPPAPPAASGRRAS